MITILAYISSYKWYCYHRECVYNTRRDARLYSCAKRTVRCILALHTRGVLGKARADGAQTVRAGLKRYFCGSDRVMVQDLETWWVHYNYGDTESIQSNVNTLDGRCGMKWAAV